MTVLVYRYGNICEPDIIDTFKEFGIEVAEICEEITDKKLKAARRVELVSEKINEFRPIFVFSVNFFPAIAEVCHIYGIPYFCWTVDSPVLELFSKSIMHNTNRIFLFDRAQYNYFCKFNPDCTFYLPLAAATERFDRVLSAVSQKDIDRFSCDISFVGSLYSEKNPLNKMKLPEYISGYIKGVVEASLRVYGYNFTEEVMTDECIRAIKDNSPGFYAAEDCIVNPDQYVAAHSYVGYQIAETERISTLNTIAEYFNVDLFTKSDCSTLRNVHIHGGVQTLTEMPIIFNKSRINLNMTIKPIQTGLPLRIFDIMGCGGFCMTNYQEELSDFFEIGVDLEAYSSMEELSDKCAYYLENEEKRVQIARNGYRKVTEGHTYKMRVAEMLKSGMSSYLQRE